MSLARLLARSRAVLVTVAVTAGLICAPQAALAAPENQAATASPAAASVTWAQMTAAVYADTNQVRFDSGRNGLARNSALDKVAADWAYQQWKNGAMSHNPSYSKQIPSGWTRAGENVAKGYTYLQVVDAWVASSGHYANLIGDYTSIGIGYYEGPDGKRYWSQVFAKYPGTTVPLRPTAPTPTYPAEPAAPSGATVALKAPSFEGSVTGWVVGTAKLFGPSVAVRGGKYALASTGGTVSQTVSFAPVAGGTYTATIWVSPGSTSAVSGTLNLTALGGTIETARISFTVSSGWMKVSVPLRVVRAAHTGLRIDVVLPAGGSYRIDSASLVRTA